MLGIRIELIIHCNLYFVRLLQGCHSWSKTFFKYSQTWSNDHLQIATTNDQHFVVKCETYFMNDFWTTTTSIFGSRGWSMGTALTLSIFSAKIIILIKNLHTFGHYDKYSKNRLMWSLWARSKGIALTHDEEPAYTKMFIFQDFSHIFIRFNTEFANSKFVSNCF